MGCGKPDRVLAHIDIDKLIKLLRQGILPADNLLGHMSKFINDDPKGIGITSAPDFDPAIQVVKRPEHLEPEHFLILLTPEIKEHRLLFPDDLIPVNARYWRAKHCLKCWIQGKGENFIQKRRGQPRPVCLA